ncbi:glycosyl transferase [Virgibacillus phasianinus]|uniref:Glycosyl transferase n=2 Tax=Virgibacillus phasianinus TaxID=2017483 RepID=A0A220TZN3_9BACI|nr:glycosyltransferase [Virgibacillus phasianinus]ASK61093.1 glycosyl transferase [Virgibacillus phasianinus]
MMKKNKKRILVGSPVHQKPEILNEFLLSLTGLKSDSFDLDFFFVDDNNDEKATELLLDFKQHRERVTIYQSKQEDDYFCDDQTHYWNEQLVWKVANFKNRIIKKAVEEQYDYLFLIDSDLVLHPMTMEYLVKADKDIVSEVFWTKWQPVSEPQPQVWLVDEYGQWHQERGEELSDKEIAIRYQSFLSMLKIPGLYEVGGLGACTLISKKALTIGVNFNPIKNLSFWGEDRHFCVRAAAMGISLYVDTHVPAYHIYRKDDLKGIDKFKNEHQGTLPDINVITGNQAKLTLSMVVKNESDRFLKHALKEHRKYIDEAVIIDDGSTDDTLELCLDVLNGIPVHTVENQISKFANEVELRKQQWAETIKKEPDWILNLDADEIFEKRFAYEIHDLLQQTKFDVFSFRLYDFWNSTHYREDALWRAHLTYRPFLVRHREGFVQKWKDTPQHCGRFPENIYELPNSISNLRLQHFGWANPDIRLEKFRRYSALDPESIHGNSEQYQSILDEHPNLIRWKE